MSTSLIVLVVILAVFALILIPFMLIKDKRPQKQGTNASVTKGTKQQKKKKR